jgi:hypothetical protein
VLPDERSEHEPDEPDLGPDPPDVSPGGADSGFGLPDISPDVDGFLGPGDAPGELLSAFWTLVVLFNVGLLATSLGLMVLFFEARLYLGGGLLAVGLLALARGIVDYRRIDPHTLGEDDGDADDNG